MGRGAATTCTERIDPIRVVDSVYRPAVDDEEWLRAIAAELAPALEQDQGHAAWCFQTTSSAEAIRLWGFVGTAPAGWIGAAELAAASGDPVVVDAYRRARLYTMLEQAGDEFLETPLFEEMHARTGIFDMVNLGGSDPEGYGVNIGAAASGRIALTDADRVFLTRIAAHIVNGFRLRRRLAGDAPIEAVLDLSGGIVHLEDPAKSREARAALRAAATAIDYARRKRRKSDPDDGLARWLALVAGRWSLVDQFDRDGRSFLVARRNDARCAAPQTLSARQAQVVAHAALGHTNKLIAYELGLTESAVSAHLTRAKVKLGVHSRMELGAYGSESPTDVAAAAPNDGDIVIAVDGEEFTIFAKDACPRLDVLTPAEREVVWAALAGGTNHAIASSRGIALRTVANQLRSAYQKLSVRSRTELAALLRRSP
jgi:DNA-binding NarL/FixJ family response regulator